LLENFPPYVFRGESNEHSGGPTRKKNYNLDTQARVIVNRTGPKGNKVTSVISDERPGLTTIAILISGP
jgi:hypothetical protein